MPALDTGDVDVTSLLATLLAIALVGGMLQNIIPRLAAEIKFRTLQKEAKTAKEAGKVTSLHYHPVKSLRAVLSRRSIALDAKGFQDDRRYMIVYPLPLPIYKASFDATDSTHRFFTQRQCPSLATVTATLQDEDGTLSLQCDKRKITIPREPPAKAKKMLAGLWSAQVEVLDMGDRVAQFLQEIVDSDPDCCAGDEGTDGAPATSMYKGIRLVAHTANDRRTNPKYTPVMARSWLTNQTPTTSLTDGYPVLIACQASLDELNRRLKANGKEEIPMSRFRPNIVIEGTEPFAEDAWKTISVGNQLFAIVKACPRCKQACTDQVTGKVSSEPLETMKEFRALSETNDTDVFFAQNAIPIGTPASVSIDDTVRVLETGNPFYP